MKKLALILSLMCVITVSITACDDNSKTNENNKTVVSTNNNSQKDNSNEVSTETNSSPENVENKQEEVIDISGEKEVENIVVDDESQIKEEANSTNANSEYTIIKFSDMYETKGTNKNVSTMLKNLNGKKVQIKGYPAVQSPLDESFVYLNNQPYVTCPFCTIGDITKLEVIPIFMANKSKIKYTENAMNVYGTLEVAPKLDSEGYTTQFRVYADKVEEIQDTAANKAVNEYYANLSQQGMIYDIQTLQMNIEYVSNLEYMAYYDEKFQNGQSPVLDQIAVVKGIADEYLGYDSQYGKGFGSGFAYLDYIKECPDIVKSLEPADERLKKLNDELIEMYNKEIVILEKYQNIAYKVHALGNNLTLTQAQGFVKELTALNSDNLKQYNQFTAWNNKLRE